MPGASRGRLIVLMLGKTIRCLSKLSVSGMKAPPKTPGHRREVEPVHHERVWCAMGYKEAMSSGERRGVSPPFPAPQKVLHFPKKANFHGRDRLRPVGA